VGGAAGAGAEGVKPPGRTAAGSVRAASALGGDGSGAVDRVGASGAAAATVFALRASRVASAWRLAADWSRAEASALRGAVGNVAAVVPVAPAVVDSVVAFESAADVFALNAPKATDLLGLAVAVGVGVGAGALRLTVEVVDDFELLNEPKLLDERPELVELVELVELEDLPLAVAGATASRPLTPIASATSAAIGARAHVEARFFKRLSPVTDLMRSWCERPSVRIT